MRLLRLMVLITAGLCLISPSVAQTPPNVLFPGSVFASHARGSGAWCAVDPGSSEFQRNTATGAAKISFSDITYYHSSIAPQSFLLTGQAILSFTNASSGTIAFVVNHSAPPGVARPAFKNYAQTYNATTRVLNVRFRIVFPACPLDVVLYYRG